MSDYVQVENKGTVEVPFSDDEAEKKGAEATDLLADDPKDASPEERVTRKRKRQERLQLLLQEGEKNAGRVKELEERDERREREIAELRALISQQRQPPPPPDGKDPFERALDSVYQRQHEAYKQAKNEIKAGTYDESREAHFAKIARDLETERGRILIQQEMAQAAPRQRAQQAQEIWKQKYPEVYSNPRAFQFAEATFRRKVALLEPGQEPSNDVVEEVMAETMTQFRLGPKKAPTQTERSRLSGVPSSGSGGSGGGGVITLTPALRKMAIAARDDLSEAEAIKAWVNKTGKRMRDKKVL